VNDTKLAGFGKLQNPIPKTETRFWVQKLAKLVFDFGNRVSEPFRNQPVTNFVAFKGPKTCESQKVSSCLNDLQNPA
jgi:hypothetical protein